MKNLLFILLFLLFGQHLNAQPYKSMFGKDSTTWIFKYYNLDLHAYGVADVVKDTLVNDTLWKKIELRYDLSRYYQCIMREDTMTGKVWYRTLDPNAHDDRVYLTFDFSLQPGDSFDINNMGLGAGPPGTVVMSTVDSVAYHAGLKYIYFQRMFYSSEADVPVTEEPFALIEGIGTNMGPLWKQIRGGCQAQYLMCSYKDGERTTYENLRFGDYCPDWVLDAGGVGIEDADGRQENVVIYPNPASDFITIKGLSEEPDHISIYSMDGKLVLQMNGNRQDRIPIGEIASGYYILRFGFEKHPPQHVPFIVHH